MKTILNLILFSLFPLLAFSQPRQFTITPSGGLKHQGLDIRGNPVYFNNTIPLRPELGLDLGYKLSRRIWIQSRASIVPIAFRVRSSAFKVRDVYPHYNTTYYAPGWGLGIEWEVFRESNQSIQVGYQLNINYLHGGERREYTNTLQLSDRTVVANSYINRSNNIIPTFHLTATYEMELSYNRSVVIYVGRAIGDINAETHGISIRDAISNSPLSSISMSNNGSGYYLRVGYRLYLIKQYKNLEF